MTEEEKRKTLLQNMTEADFFADLLKHETSAIVELEKMMEGHEDEQSEFYGHVGAVSLSMQQTVNAIASLIESKTKYY